MTTTFDSLYLVETVDKIFIYPTTFQVGAKIVDSIIINRVTDDISWSIDGNLIPPDNERLRTISICGVLGVIPLIAGPYLVYIKSRERVGDIGGQHVIWRLSQFDMVPFRKSLLHLSEKQIKFNHTYLDMLKTVLDTPYFYYSNSYDLSHNMQSLDSNPPDFLKQTLVARADQRFVWNRSLLDSFHRGIKEIQKFCSPLIHGFVSITPTSVNSKQFKLILISRRSAKRPGTRLFSRGIDEEGNVSNFVETEQIIEYGQDMSSFVQIRGSIPLFWTQKPNLKYKPKPVVGQLNHAEAYTRHFDDLVVRYERVNQSGSESVLEIEFKNQSRKNAISNTTYEAFDFHHECRNMNWGRLDILVNRLTNDVEQFGYFMRGSSQKQQEGVFRTNCIDCLDRTNVVQGLLAKINANIVLQKLNILRDNQRVADHPEFDYIFKNIWADNGDIVSIEYSGTGALKSDYTRTGKRTFIGVMRDGYNSAVRYIKNNFFDGFRQDAMELFVGNYTVSEKEGAQINCPLDKNRDWKYFTLPTLLVMSLAMLISLVVFPQEYSTEYLLYILFWGSMTFATSGTILYYGKEFVDSPVLIEPSRLTM